MKKFEKSIRVGTKVRIEGREALQEVEAFYNERRLVKLVGIIGHFQRADVLHYTNK